MQREGERLAEAVGMGGPMAVLVSRLEQDRQTRLAEVDAALQVEAGERRQVGNARWLGAPSTRQAGRRGPVAAVGFGGGAETGAATLLVGPLRFTPVRGERRRGYRFEGAIPLDRLVSGIVDLPMPFLRQG